MDKAEYRIATEHIKKLIAKGEYAEASHIADTIDWSRVKSVMMLCTVSDLYKINRRYEDAKEILYMAYERNPESRTILYSLCDLSIKLEEFVAAIEYYKSFVEVAPKDTGRYVLQYRLYQAQDVGLEERIEVLEQLKNEEYTEKWAYELAYLYHRIGFATKCVEECDELILWFGTGRYVYKAMELKMLHEPLTPLQQSTYDKRFEHLEQAKDMTRVLPRIDSGDSEMTDESMVDVTDAPTVEIPKEYIEKELHTEAEEIQVKTLDVDNAYNTMNLQKELADSLREILENAQAENDEAETVQEPEVIIEEVTPSAEEMVDEQIAGQLSIEDVLAEWDKQEEEAIKAQEDSISNHIKSQTQDIFAEIEREMQKDLFTVAEEAYEEPELEEEKPFEDFEELELEEEKSFEELEPAEEEAYDELELEEVKAFVELELAEEEDYDELELEEMKAFVEQELADGEGFEEEPLEDELEEITEYPIEDFEEDSNGALQYDDIEEALEAVSDAFEEELFVANEEVPSEQAEEGAAEQIEEAVLEQEPVVAVDPFGKYKDFIRVKDTEDQITAAKKKVSLKPTSGNMAVTGHDLSICFDFIKVFMTDLKKQGFEVEGKTAKISAVNLNKKDPSEIIKKVQDGVLIIERVGRLRKETVTKLEACLNEEVSSILVFVTDTDQGMDRFAERYPSLAKLIDIRVDIKDYTGDELVEYGVKYAYEQEYGIDKVGLLALRSRIDEMIINDDSPTIKDAQRIVDEAINNVNTKSLKHFMDVLLRKRYDAEDMIVLREKDFL